MQHFQSRLVCVFLLCAQDASFCRGALAAEHPDEEPDQHWALGAGGQSSDHHGTTLDAYLGYFSTQDVIWHFGLSRSRLPGAASGVTTNDASLNMSHRGKTVGLSLGAHAFEDVGIIKGRDVTVVVPLHTDNWHVNVEGHVRRSDFDPFHAATVVKLPSGSSLTVNATATCTLDNTGYGAEAGLDGVHWAGYVRTVQYRYDANQCSFDSPGLDALKKTNPQEFKQLAATVTNRLSKLAVSHLRNTSADSYLAAEVDAGVRYAAGRALWGIDYQHGRDEFEGVTSDTFNVTADFDVMKSSDVEVELGTSRAQSIGTSTFVGLHYTRRF